MKTIGRNTKEFKKAISEATGITVYSLGNYFNGEPAKGFSSHDVESAKLVKGNGKYSLRVHSNLWYEWEAA